MKTAGVSGGPIRQDLTPGQFLMARWLGNSEAGVMEQWSVGLLGLRRIAPPSHFWLVFLASNIDRGQPLTLFSGR